MSYIFYRCSSLSSIPDISKWNTNNIVDMSYMFYRCSSLSSLPDLSNWNTNNIIDMSHMFSGCSKLSSFISKWTIKNTDIRCMFYKCSSLIPLPDISKWNINNEEYKRNIFYGCIDISDPKFNDEFSDIDNANNYTENSTYSEISNFMNSNITENNN